MKIVDIGKKEEAEIYIHEAAFIFIEHLTEYIKNFGCKELHFIVVNENDDVWIEGTEEFTHLGLGALERYKYRYSVELDEKEAEEDEED